MLAAMNDRSFVVTIAYIKTEPVQVALFGLIFLGDVVTPRDGGRDPDRHRRRRRHVAQARARRSGRDRPTLLGLAAGAMFALSAIGFRGAILRLGGPSYVMAATFTLVVGLLLQAVLLSLYLWLRDRDVLAAIVRAWRPSLFAGFMGALASQFWFLAFALATAASVRTLALVEVLFAQAISRFVFKQATTTREALGIVLIVIGVALLIWAHDCGSDAAQSAPDVHLVALVGQHRQRVELDAFLVQLLGLLRRGLAVDRAVLDLAVMHLARFFGKFLADIVGVLGRGGRAVP